MSREIDERIVAMYFDNRDFEKNAQTTLHTLDELKKGMNLEDSAKGFDVFEKASKKLHLEDAKNKVNKLQTALKGLKTALQTTFEVSTAPLRRLGYELDHFKNRYLDRVIGFDIASKIAGSMESMFRSLFVTPISSGWGQYESRMDSIKTIMSGSGESIDVVTNKLEKLTKYANKTIYSLSDMTSNIGKFTNNGVSLDRATMAIMGIANATALAGQNAQSAAMAMYNVSQAMGVGYMLSIDWKSLENANIATKELKQTMIDVAVAKGELVKVTEKDKQSGKEVTKYYVKGFEKGKNKMEVSVKNFRETLSKKWLTADVMEAAFGIYSGDMSVEEIQEMTGMQREEAQALYDLGQQALQSASEVRTFTKMMDALSESVQSGWAESFELIFGNMDEGTNLWTELNDTLSAILDAQAENRNNILRAWRGEIYDSRREMNSDVYWEDSVDEFGKRKKRVLMPHTINGRDELIGSMREIMAIFKEFGSTVSSAWEKAFGKISGVRLAQLTQKFHQFTSAIRTWLGSANVTGTRMNKIQTGLHGLFSILKVVVTFIKSGISLIGKFVAPIADVFINLFGKFGEIFGDFSKDMTSGQILKRLGDGFSKLWEKLKKLDFRKLFENIGNWISESWKKVKATLKEWGKENGLEGVGNFLSNIWTSIKNVWNGFVLWLEESGIAGFFRNTWIWICGAAKSALEFFTVGDENGETGFAKFIGSIYDWIKTAWDSIVAYFDSGAGKGIKDFFVNTWNWICQASMDTLAFFKEIDPETGKTGFISFIESVGSWIEGAWQSITEWFDSGPGKDFIQFFSDTWEWIKARAGEVWTFFTMPSEDTGDTGFIAFLKGLGTTISDAWGEVVKWFNEGDGKNLISFFSDVWAWIADKANGVWNFFTMPVEDTGETGFIKFLTSIKSSIVEAWGSVSAWFETGDGHKFVQFVSDTWGWIQSQFTATVKSGYVNGHLESWVEKAPVVTFLSNIWEEIKTTWNEIVGWPGWTAIGEFLSDTWNWVISLVNGNPEAAAGSDKAKEYVQESNGVIKAVAPDAESISETLNDVELDGDAEQKVSLLTRIIEALGDFWEKVKTTFNGISDRLGFSTYVDSLKTLMTGVQEIILALSEVLGKALSWGARMLTGKATQEDWKTFWLTVVVGFISWIAKALSVKNKTKLLEAASNTESIATKLLAIGASLFLIAEAINILGNMDIGKLMQGEIAVAIIGVVLGFVIKSLTSLKEAANATKAEQGKVTSLERIGQTILKWAGIALVTKIAMDGLVPIIAEIGKYKADELNSDAILKSMLGIAALVAGMALMVMLISKNASNMDIGATLKGTLAVTSSIVVGLAVLIGGLQGIFAWIAFSDQDGTFSRNVEASGEVLAKISEAIGKFFAGFGAGSRIEKNKADNKIVNQTFDNLADMADQFTEEKIGKIQKLLEVFNNIAEIVQNQTGYSLKWDDFPTKAEKLGEGVQKLLTVAIELENAYDFEPGKKLNNPELNYGRLERFLGIGLNMTDMMKDMNDIITVMDSGAYDRILAMGDSPFDAYKKIIQSLLDAFSEGVDGKLSGDSVKFNATPIVDAIVKAMGLGSSSIATAVHDMVQSGLDAMNEEGQGFNMPENFMGGLGNVFDFLNSGDITGLLGGGFDLSGVMDQLIEYDGNGNVKNVCGMDFSAIQQAIDTGMNNLSIPDANSLFDESGWLKFLNTDGEEEDYFTLIQSELQTLTDSFEDLPEFEIKIRPVFDLTELTPEKVQERLGSIPYAMSGKMVLPDSTNGKGAEILAELRSVNSKMDGLANTFRTEGSMSRIAVSGLAPRIDAVGKSISGVKLVLDTGVLVGEITPMIDRNLYLRSVINGRTGTSPRSSNGLRPNYSDMVTPKTERLTS